MILPIVVHFAVSGDRAYFALAVFNLAVGLLRQAQDDYTGVCL